MWTRSIDDFESDEPMVRALLPTGWELMHIPCLFTTPLATVAPSGSFEAAIILSPNTIRYAMADVALKGAITGAKAIYTHGATTAASLAEVGLKAHLVKDVRTSEDLAKWLGKTLPKGARCLWPTAAEPAFDLVKGLNAEGLVATRINCYRTETGARRADGVSLTAREITDLTAHLNGVVCFASPSAVNGFAQVFEPLKNRLRSALVAAVMGPTTATAANLNFEHVVVASASTLRDMVRAGLAVNV